MQRLIVYLGGIRSGKSQLAEARFKKELRGRAKQAYYLASIPSSELKRDPELKKRVARHQERRPKSWTTLELGEALGKEGNYPAFLLDGFGLWLARRYGEPWDAIEAEIQAFLNGSAKLAILVLDEVGQGGVGAHPASRLFADRNGEANQVFCSAAKEVWRVDAGIATRLK